MRGPLSSAARGGFALTLALIVLALLRWDPVFVAVPFDLRALPLVPPLVACAVVAAVSGRERELASPARPLLALALAVAALAAAVAVRGRGGLQGEVAGPAGVLGRLAGGPIDVAGPDLREMEGARRRVLRWSGELRVPETGGYRLWADGRGDVLVTLDGWPALRASGDPLNASSQVALTAGAHALAVEVTQVGPGARFRLGWVRPGEQRGEVIPPRCLGGAGRGLLWRTTDLLALLVAGLAGLAAWRLPWDRPRPLPAPAAVRPAEVLAVLAALTAVVVVMSWPLARDLVGHSLMQYPDGRLNAWILAWDVHAVLHEPSRLFQAPIFHPLPDALAFSENLLLPALVAAPAIRLGGPALGYNLVLLGSFVLSGLGVHLLVRRVSGDALAAFVGAALFAAGAHRWIRLAHLHAQVTVFLPFALLALERFWERRTWPRALLVGLAVALQGLASVYLGAITATTVAVAVLVALAAGLKARDLWRLAVAGALAGALLAVVVAPYLRMRAFQGMEWTLSDLAVTAATPESWVASGSPLWGSLTQRHLEAGRARDTLFPGLATLALGLAGLARAPRRYQAVGVAVSLAAFLLSLGPATALYRFLHEHLVLFRGIRALARYSIVVSLALAVMAGLALAGTRALRLVALALALLEVRHAPIGVAPLVEPGEAARWLAGRAGAVAVLPLGERDTEAMLEGLAHLRPLLNGDSGFVPRSYDRARELFHEPFGDAQVSYLRALGVTHVVSREELPLPLAVRFGEERVYEVPPGQGLSVPRPSSSPVSWGGGEAVADLGRPRTFERVDFEAGDGPWLARPRVGLSSDGVAWQEVEGEAPLGELALALTRDPRHARGTIALPSVSARYLRLDPRLPARAGTIGVAP